LPVLLPCARFSTRKLGDAETVRAHARRPSEIYSGNGFWWWRLSRSNLWERNEDA
jgi:hypothetical protein